MSRCIVTYAAGAHEELLEISSPRFQQFAAKHGYDFFVGEKFGERPAWNKVLIMIDALKLYDQVTWLDADLVITNIERDFPFFVGSHCYHQLVRHFSGMSEVPNTGVWTVSKAAIPMLRKMLDLEVFSNHGWWEQAALMTLMGYTVPPEGSDFDLTRCRCVKETEYTKACHFIKVEWNSHPNYRADKARIVHCSYPNMRQRIDVMKALIKDPEFAYPEWEKKK